jgi:hypothetical protein
MSAPAQKWSPAPVSTITRASSVALNSAKMRASSPHMVAVTAFRRAGRSKTTRATPAGSVVTTMSALRPVTLRAEDAIRRTLIGDR